MNFRDLPVGARYKLYYDSPAVWEKVDEDFGRILGEQARYMADPENTVWYPHDMVTTPAETYDVPF